VPTNTLTGSIGSSGLPDLFLSLNLASSTGRLSLERDGVLRDLWLRDGLLIGAESSASSDSLEWLLLTAGVLDEEEHRAVRALIQTGVGRGRALVEKGGVSPVSLCDWTERRTRFLMRDLLSWTSGAYRFETGEQPPPGSITVELDTAEVLIEALREGVAAPPLSESLPAPDTVVGPLDGAAARARHLNAAERYVLSLADGRRSLAEICGISEIGETGTKRILALLAAAGCVGGRSGGTKRNASAAAGVAADRAGGLEGLLSRPLDVPAGETSAELRAGIRIYNDVFVFLYAYMIKEVGPIAEQLLEKTLRDVREEHAALFARVITCRDGSLPEDTLVRNANLLKERRRDTLVAALHDYLTALTIAVRRILGPEHERRVLQRLREMRCTRA